MRQFKFETGAIVNCDDERIAKLLQADKRYKEIVEEKAEKEVETQKPKTSKKGGK